MNEVSRARRQPGAATSLARRRVSGGQPIDHPATEEPAAAIGERLAYTVEEAAAALGIGRDLIYDEIRTGRLRSKKAGARRVIGRHHLLEWLDSDSAAVHRRAS